MEELRYIVVPYWLSNVIDTNLRSDYSQLLSLESMLGILSPNDVGFYLAAQKFELFAEKVAEVDSVAVHLQALTGGLLAYSYDESMLPVEKQTATLCRYLNSVANGYEKLLFDGPAGLGNQAPDKSCPLYIEVKSVNENTIALVTHRCRLETEESHNDRLCGNYRRVIDRLRITRTLSQVSELPVFQSYSNHRSLHFRLRRL